MMIQSPSEENHSAGSEMVLSTWMKVADKKKDRNKPPYVVVPAIKLELRRFSNGCWEKLLGILVVYFDVDDFFICAYRNKQRVLGRTGNAWCTPWTNMVYTHSVHVLH